MTETNMDTMREIERFDVTSLRRRTAEILCRVHNGERFIITSSGEEKAALVRVSDLEWLLGLLAEHKDRHINEYTGLLLREY